MTEEYKLTMSPLCQTFEKDGKAVKIEIYNGDEGGWVLEVEDQFGNSTVWDDEFDTDQEALEEAINTINTEGIDSLIGSPTGGLH